MKKLLITMLASVMVLGIASAAYATQDTEGEPVILIAPAPDETGEAEDVLDIAAAPVQYAFDTAEDLTALPEQRDALNMTAGTIVNDIYYLGQSLSGMTIEEAAPFLRAPLENLMAVDYSLGSSEVPEYTMTASGEQLGITTALGTIESQLDGTVVSGNLLERYKFAKDFQLEPRVIDPQISVNYDTVYNFFQPNLDLWHTEPKSASVSSLTGETVVTPGVTGMTYDCSNGVQQLINDVMTLSNLPEDHHYTIAIDETRVEPALTTERANTFSIIGSFYTAYFEPDTPRSANREKNLITSTSHMNGTIVEPGGTISALTMYGPITRENGYEEAGTFNEGQHSVEMGGGICQTTTTLYNACLMAEFDIVERRHHSMMVTYVDPSRDAMVYATGGLDFKAVNNSSDYIIIESYVSQADHTLHVLITGHEDHPAGHRVEYESERCSLTIPSITCIDDPDCGTGFNATYHLATEDGPTAGLTSKLWKITYEEGKDPVREPVNQYKNGYVDKYNPSNSAVYHISPVMKLRLAEGSSREGGYLSLVPEYLDGTHLSANPATWTDEERIAFNKKMQKLCKEKGITWPYTNNGWTDEDPDGDEPETTEPETKKHKKGDKETTEADDKPEKGAEDKESDADSSGEGAVDESNKND